MTAVRFASLPWAMLRHVFVFTLAAVAIVLQALYLAVPLDVQFSSWLFVAIGVGLLSALLARRPLGVLFVVAGLTVGLLAIFATQLGLTSALAPTMATAGILYVEVIEVAALAYLLTAIVLSRLVR